MVEIDDDDALKDAADMKNIEQLEKKIGTLQLTKISREKPRVELHSHTGKVNTIFMA